MGKVELLAALDAATASGDGLGRAISAVFHAAKEADGSAHRDMLAELDVRIAGANLENAGKLALLAGAIVEVGGAPAAFPPSVFNRLLALLDTVRGKSDEIELPPPYFELERAAMACLSRSSLLRRTLPQKKALVDATVRYSERYGFLGKMVRVLDDEPLVVLHVPTARGFLLRMSGIADNFQLHALLLVRLAGEGGDRIPGAAQDPGVEIAATDGQASAHVNSHWQLANAAALVENEDFVNQRYRSHWIWNEGMPAEIERFDGTRLVLVGDGAIARSWSAGRLFNGMPGSLVVERALSSAESASVLARLRGRRNERDQK